MKKLTLLLISIITLFGCQPTTNVENELDQYYLSISTADKSKRNVKIQLFDFKTNKTLISENIEGESQYLLHVYDYENECILYTINDTDNIYLYNLKDKSSKQITTDLKGVDYIISRKDDYIITSYSQGINCIYKMDKETYKLEQITLSYYEYNDMSVSNIFYIPQTDEVIIQAENLEENYNLLDKWNNENHTLDEDFVTPYYFYVYGDEVEYLFEYEMFEPSYMVSNGKDIMFEVPIVNNVYKYHEVCRYNRQTKELSEEKVLKGLSGVFYMSNDGQYLYQILEDKFVRVDYNKNETKKLLYEVDTYNLVNCILSKK